MNQGQFVGRVGALAVALGIGAAIAMPASAWADDTQPGADPSPGSSQSQSREHEPQTQSDDTPSDDGQQNDGQQNDDPQDDDQQDDEDDPSDPEGTDAGEPDTEDEPSTAPESEQQEDNGAEQPETIDPTPTNTFTPQQPSTGSNSHRGESPPVETPPSPTLGPADLAEQLATTPPQRGSDEEGDAVIGVLTIGDDGTAGTFVQRSVVTTLDVPDPAPAPNPLDPLLAIPGALFDAALGLTVALLQPIIVPGGPFDNALLWGVLAWTRREATQAIDYQAPLIATDPTSLTV